MTEKQWDTFFELLSKIVNEGRPVVDKTAQVLEKARDRDDEVNLVEFASWNFGQ